MTWTDRIVIGAIGGAVAFVLWLVQRWMTRAGETEAIDRLTKKLDAIEKLEKQGLPSAKLSVAVAKDIEQLSTRSSTDSFHSSEAVTDIVDAMKAAAESDATKVVTVAEIESLERERAKVYDELIGELLRHANTLEGTAATFIDGPDPFLELLALLHRAKAMRLTAEIEASRIPLGGAGIGAGACAPEWIEEKLNSIRPADEEDEASLESFATIRELTVKELNSCKAARERLE